MGGFTTGRVGTVFVDIEGDLSKLEKAMSEAVPEAAKAGEKIGNVFSEGIASGTAQIPASINASTKALEQLGSTIGGLSNSAATLGGILTAGITLPLAGFATAAVGAASDIDSLKRGLVAITGSSEEAGRQFDSLREVAKLPGLGLEEAVRGSINLQAFGLSASESKDALLAFGNALGSVGKGKAELDRVILQLGQMAGAGKVLLQDLRPIIQTVPQVSQIIREQFGPNALSAPAETLAKLGINSREFIEILVRELGKLPQVTSGIKNALENLADSSKIALANFGDSMTPAVEAISNNLGPALVGLSEQWKGLPGLVQNTVLAFGGFAASVPPAILTIAGVGKTLEAFIDISAKAGRGLKDLEKSYGDWANAGKQATDSVDGLSGAIGGATGGAVGNVGLFKTAVTDLVGGLSGGEGLMAALGVAGTAMVSFGAAALVTEGNILAMENQVTDAANEIRKLQILSFVDQGKLEELKKLGVGLDEIKAAMTGASKSFDQGRESAAVLEGAQKQLAKSGLLIIDGNKKLTESSEDVIRKQAEANAAVMMAKATYEDLAAALKRGEANVSIEAVNRAYVQWQKTIKEANPTIKEAALSTLDLGEKYERLAQRFRDGKATAEEVIGAYDKLVLSQRALGEATGFTTGEINKQLQSFADIAINAGHVNDILSKMSGLTYDQASAVADAVKGEKSLSEELFKQTDRYRALREAKSAGLISTQSLKAAEGDLLRALEAAHPEIDKNSDAWKMLKQSAGIAADSIVRVGEVSQGMNTTIQNGITVITGSSAAARDAGNAYRDMGAGASEAGTVIDILTGKVEKLADVAARAKQTMGTDWPGNSQQGLNSAANSGGTGVDGIGGANMSAASYLAMLAQMGAPSDVIHRAAEAFGLVVAGENSFMTPEEFAALGRNYTSTFMTLRDSMRATTDAARDASAGIDTLTAELEAAKTAAFGEDKRQAVEDFTDEAERLQEQVNRLAGRLYDLRMEGRDGEQEYRDLQTQLMQASAQLDNVNQRLATFGVSSTVAGAGLQYLQSSTNALSGAAKAASEVIIGSVASITAAVAPAGAAALPPTIMPNVGGPSGSPGGGAAGGSLVNVGNGRLQWVPPGGVTVVQNINGGTFSSTAFVNEVGKGLVEVLGRDVGAKL